MEENKVTEETKIEEPVKEQTVRKAEAIVENPKTENLNQSELKVIADLLKDIKVDEHKEMKYAKRQSVTSLILSILCLVIVGCIAVSIVLVIPKVNKLLKTADDTIKQASLIMEDAQTAVNNLNKVTTDLSHVNISEIVDNINGLVTESQDSISQAMKQLTSIDFEGLNSAIEDLGAIVEPLANLFGR